MGTGMAPDVMGHMIEPAMMVALSSRLGLTRRSLPARRWRRDPPPTTDRPCSGNTGRLSAETSPAFEVASGNP